MPLQPLEGLILLRRHFVGRGQPDPIAEDDG